MLFDGSIKHEWKRKRTKKGIVKKRAIDNKCKANMGFPYQSLWFHEHIRFLNKNNKTINNKFLVTVNQQPANRLRFPTDVQFWWRLATIPFSKYVILFFFSSQLMVLMTKTLNNDRNTPEMYSKTNWMMKTRARDTLNEGWWLNAMLVISKTNVIRLSTVLTAPSSSFYNTKSERERLEWFRRRQFIE